MNGNEIRRWSFCIPGSKGTTGRRGERERSGCGERIQLHHHSLVRMPMALVDKVTLDSALIALVREYLMPGILWRYLFGALPWDF